MQGGQCSLHPPGEGLFVLDVAIDSRMDRACSQGLQSIIDRFAKGAKLGIV